MGSRPGALVAGTWAAMMHVGEDGYRDACKAVVQTTRKIVNGIAKVPGVVIPTVPKGRESEPSYGLTVMVPISSNDFEVHALGEKLAERGWELATLLFPPALHFGENPCVSLAAWSDRSLVAAFANGYLDSQ